MEKLEIRNTGVAALVITIGGRRILVDAFNTINQPEPIVPGDLILFTHDDGDHFSPEKLPNLIGQDVTVIGPPTILKPILELGKAGLEQLKVLYSKDPQNPDGIIVGDICIKAIHTQHFNGWDALNNSYLIKAGSRRIYITGDSLVTKELFASIGKPEILICNLVEEGFLKGTEDKRHAIHHLLSYLLKVSSECNSDRIIGVHLLNFEGTVPADEMKQLVKAYDFSRIIIPISPTQMIQL